MHKDTAPRYLLLRHLDVDAWLNSEMTVLSLQIQKLTGRLTVFEDRLEKVKKDCLAAFDADGIPAKFVDSMIEEAQSGPQKHPRLQSIYHYCQKVLEMKKQIQQLAKVGEWERSTQTDSDGFVCSLTNWYHL